MSKREIRLRGPYYDGDRDWILYRAEWRCEIRKGVIKQFCCDLKCDQITQKELNILKEQVIRWKYRQRWDLKRSYKLIEWPDLGMEHHRNIIYLDLDSL